MTRSVLIYLIFPLLFLTFFEASADSYVYNPFAAPADWESFAPYFLPEDHPVRDKLDRIFQSSPQRVLRNKKTLKKARFKVQYHGKKLNPYIASHPEIPGYLFKIQLDCQSEAEDGRRFLWRIHGAAAVRQAIVRNRFEKIFQVPRKWVYPLPMEAVPPRAGTVSPKNFILVVEKMNVLGFEKNLRKWKSKAMTPELLESIYTMLDEVGLSDTTYAFNLPFCKDGRLAFVDTEHFYDWPVDFGHLARYLSPVMGFYWFTIIERNSSN